MPDKYVINVISNKEKQEYIEYAQLAIVSLKNKITKLQQMVADNVAMPTMNQPHQVAFYIKDAIGIQNRASQSGLTSGATNESYYIRFIPINKQDIVVDLRTTDHLRGEEWSDRMDDGEHPNLRASAIVQDTSVTTPTVVTKKPHIANGIKIKRVVQNIPTMLYGTPEQVIKHLNTLVCLFQNGHFGKYKEKKAPPTVDSNNKTLKKEQYMIKKELIRLTESDLHKIVKESVERILAENAVEEGAIGRWIRAGIDAASQKQRTNPQLQTYKGEHFGDSIGNWWNRTKQNAQNEKDINYIQNRTNRLNNNIHSREFGGEGDEYYQRAKQRIKQHNARLQGRSTIYGTVRDDNGRVRNFSSNNGNNYNYRGNGQWERNEDERF